MLGPAWNKVSAWGSLRGPWATSAVDPDAAAYASRVVADGGTVEDIGFLSDFFQDAKANNYYSDIVAAYSPSWGVKGTTTASKLYSIIGAAQDIVQTTADNQPTINKADLAGRTRILTDGVNDSIRGAFAFTQPETVILMGFEQEAWAANKWVCDGAANSSGSLLQSGVTPQLKIYAGSTAATNGDAAVGTPAHSRHLLNGAAAAIQIDGNAETTGDAGALDMAGFTFGSTGASTANSNVSVGAIVLLDAAIDGNYAAKMAAIYAFSKGAYATP